MATRTPTQNTSFSCRMRHMMMNHALLLSIILAFYFVCSNHVLADFTRYWVYILSAVLDNSTQLLIQCQSKDDDLGYHYLSNGQDFHWHFRMNFFQTTRFFCQFQWNSKDTILEVFFVTLARYCETPMEPWICVWVVKPDTTKRVFGDES
ncbi:hypothetical protein ACSBR1_031369 [Camellia fascicularis]